MENDDIDIDFELADKLFDNYINSCEIEEQYYIEPSELIISTITLTGQLGTKINKEEIYKNLEINDEIIYIEYNNNIKGIKEEKKVIRKKKNIIKKKDKRCENKGKSFGNQISIGIKGILNKHKKPICLKIFKNGGIHMAGCRSLEEGNEIYNIIKKNLEKKNKEKKREENKLIEGLKELKDANLSVKMINSTFRTNFEFDQFNLYNILKDTYSSDDVFVTYNCCLSSPVRCYLMKMSIYDEKKKKEKQPSIFIYRSGSVNVVVPSMDLLEKSYKFINNFFKLNFEKIIIEKIKLETGIIKIN